MPEQPDQEKLDKLDEQPINYQCTLYKSKYNPEFVSDSEYEVSNYDKTLEKVALDFAKINNRRPLEAFEEDYKSAQYTIKYAEERERKARESDAIFIKHIQGHLKSGEEVICKICGKSAKEIISQNEGEKK